MIGNRNIVEALFGIDSRALGCFRIGIALTLLYDLFIRAGDLNVFYTDNGLYPRSALLSSPWIVSIHFMNGSFWGQVILLTFQGLCAFSLLAGYRTRLMSFLCWFLLASLQRRNPLLLGGADNYLRMMLFWAMFLPLGLHYSIDSIRKIAPQAPLRICNWGTIAVLLQTFFVYFFTALYKWPGEFWRDGTALNYAFHIDLYAKPLSQLLLFYPLLIKGLTYFVLMFETVAPFLLFFPFYTDSVRKATVLAFIVMQIGFASLLYLEIFPAVSIASVLLFLPSSFWDRWLPAPAMAVQGGYKASLLTDTTAAFFLIFVFVWLCAQFSPQKIRLPLPLTNLGNLMYINQQWKMFAPNPARFTGWLVIPGYLRGGGVVDLHRDGASLSWDKPARKDLFKNERWRKYSVHYVLFKNAYIGKDYARYLCHDWNAKHKDDKVLQTLEIDVMSRLTTLEKEQPAYDKRVLLRYDCALEKVTYEQ